MTTFKDAAGIEGMRVAGKLASEVLDYLTPFLKPGVTTNEIDRLAHDYMTQVQGTIPATLNYQPSGYAAYQPALGLEPRPVAPSSLISPPAPVDAPANGEMAVGWLCVSTFISTWVSTASVALYC